jgi:hypothetical protein
MITSLSTAFYIAVSTGVAAGAGAGRVRKMRDPNESMLAAMWYGGIAAAFVFGAAVAFDRLAHFLLWEHDPTSPRDMLEFTVFVVLGLAVVFILNE